MRKYPTLYSIVRKKNVTVAQVLSTTPLNISFRLAIVGSNLTYWLEQVGSGVLFQFTELEDEFVWTLNKGSFSVSSLFEDLM